MVEGVPSEMEAVQVIEFHKPYKIQKVPVPQDLGPHDLLMKTVVGSLCHTDNMVVEGKFPAKLPQIASHEGTGIVAAVGSEVTNFKKGDRVMAGLMRGECQKCENCTGPDYNKPYCQNIDGIIGVTMDGCFAEYVVVDARISCHIPENVSFASAAPLACAGCTIYRAIEETHAQKGGWIAIVGAGGGLGHLGIQMAKAIGLNVIAIDARDEALELCKRAGAEHVFDARIPKDELVSQIQKLTPNGLGVDSAINVSEHSTAAATGCAVTKMHGRLIQVAQPDQVCVPFQELIFRDITIKGTLVAGAEQSQKMLNLVSEHKIHVETNIFHGLNEVPKMVELAHSGKMKGKAVVVIDEEAHRAEQGKVDV